MQRPPLTPSPDAPAPSTAQLAVDDGPGPQRRCIVTGDVLDRGAMIRYVVGPDGSLVPDLKAVLPGRGFWTRAERAAVQKAEAKHLFAKAAARAGHQGPLAVAPDTAGRIEALLTRRCIDLIGLGRRAGAVIAGFDKVDGLLRKEPVAFLLAASDGAADGKRKLKALSRELPQIDILTSAELSLALGRENVIHAAFKPGRLAEQFLGEAGRLAGFRLLVTAKGPVLPRAGAQAE
ncbi:RNA-binding protein [Zavarzinia sp.]|uniref:RNA-binding protein n=1 Tax=Zavarzinia sp. TaxID=2027920 RepID=UPI003562F521